MKKTVKILGLLAAAFVMGLGFVGCGDASIDDGTDIVDVNDGTSGKDDGSDGSGSSEAGDWQLCKNKSYNCFDMQVWADGAGTFNFENGDGLGRFTVTDLGGGWIGGGLICADSSTTLDFTGVTKMKFDIRGSFDTKALCLCVQAYTDKKVFPAENSLNSQAQVASLSKTEWTTVELSMPDVGSANVNNAFCLVGKKDWGGTMNVNDYFEIRNLDWVDNNGNSVTIKMK